MHFIKFSFSSIVLGKAEKNSFYFCVLVMLLIFEIGNVRASSNQEQYSDNYHDINDNEYCQVYDPYEALNRKIFIFNGVLDTFILRPFAKGYRRFTNDYTKNRIESFVGNISEPLSTVNYMIQGNADGAFKSFWRFAINSTFGIAGIFDVAGKLGLTPPQQTFGNSLAHYGVGPGPYLMLPMYGGISARDLGDPLIANRLFNPLDQVFHKDFKILIGGAKVLYRRADIMPFTDYISKNSLDPYIAVREATFSQRESSILYPKGYKCSVAN